MYIKQKDEFLLKNNLIFLVDFYVIPGSVRDPFHGFMKRIRVDPDPQHWPLHFFLLVFSNC